jgi:hypothetical protein
VAWTTSESPHFEARHETGDARDVAGVLDQLEQTHERLARAFPAVPDRLSVVVHGSDAALLGAVPIIGLVRRVTAPAARRYVAGWPTATTLHVLAPRLLAARASNVPGSKELALLTPAALLAQVAAGRCASRQPPPFRLRALLAAPGWSWVFWGSGQFFSGQTEHARGPIGRRLREGGEPSFPPSLRDAPLLGGTVLDLLAREEGEQAVVDFVCDPPPGSPRRALEQAFHGRPTVHTEGTWRAHLAKLAGAAT